MISGFDKLVQHDPNTGKMVDNYLEQRSYHYRHVTPRLDRQEAEDE